MLSALSDHLFTPRSAFRSCQPSSGLSLALGVPCRQKRSLSWTKAAVSCSSMTSVGWPVEIDHACQKSGLLYKRRWSSRALYWERRYDHILPHPAVQNQIDSSGMEECSFLSQFKCLLSCSRDDEERGFHKSRLRRVLYLISYVSRAKKKFIKIHEKITLATKRNIPFYWAKS